MLWMIAALLMILGLVTGFTMGVFIHILLVVTFMIVLVSVIQKRRPV
ncbi:MAG: hypothetical protein ABSB79_08480 [Syntrophales bacterium]|jgi:hypothetical protein